MATKPKKSSKASKPDCKVWVQAGEELLPEYMNKPIEGVEGYECYIVVALNDLLSINCEAKPGVFDEYVLVVDGVIRGCEPRRNTKVVFDKALNRAAGKGKNPGAVFRGDMSVQMRDSDQSRFAEAGEELSKVGSIILEGWAKVGDPLSTKEKEGELLKFSTYDVNRKWYDLNRFVNPTPGHLPPFEIGFVGETRCPPGSGYRTRVAGAAERNTAEWKLAYKYIFHLRSASEMHKLGQTDVLVRNPKIDLFAEHPEEAAEKAEEADVEEEDAEEDEDAEEVEEAEKSDDEIVVESEPEDDVEAEEELSVRPSNEEKPALAKPEASDKTGDDTAEVLKAAGALKKSTSKPKTVDKIPQKPEGKPDQKSAETPKKKKTPKPKSATPSGQIEALLSPSGSQVVAAKPTPKKKSLSGIKSAPASKASRVRSTSEVSNASKVLQSIEQPEEPLMSPALTKLADTSTGLPVTPPPSSMKRNFWSRALEGAKLDRAIFSASPMALKAARQDRRVRSETRTYEMPGDCSFVRGQDGETAGSVINNGLGEEDSTQITMSRSVSRRVSFKGEHPSSRAQSEVSDVSTEVADPVEMQARMEKEGWTSGSLSQDDMSFGRSQMDVTPEPRNHTESSPILGRSFTGHTQSEGSAEFLGVKYSHEQKVEIQESPSTQIRSEIADSFRAPVAKDNLTQKHGNQIIQPSQKISRASSLAVSFPKHQQSFSGQPEGFVGKRKASESTGNGSTAEDARPAKFPMPPANRAIIDSLRRQQEENDRLEQELKDLREYNTTLENIRELRKKGHGVQERIEAEKARQAALEAELGQ